MTGLCSRRRGMQLPERRGGPGSRDRAWVGFAATAVLVVLAVVVVAGAQAGAGGPQAPAVAGAAAAPVLRALLILTYLGEVAVIALVAWALWPERGVRRRPADRSSLRLMMLASFLQALLVIVLIWLRLRAGAGGLASLFAPAPGDPAMAHVPPLPGIAGLPGGGDWLTALIVVASIAAALGYLILSGAHRPWRRKSVPVIAERLAAAASAAIDDASADADARAGVIRAYLRMTQTLAAEGLPRARHETELEYMERVFEWMAAPSEPITRLTILFSEARFSQHPVGDDMRRDAVAALETIREDLGAIAAGRASTPALAPR